MEFKHLGPMTGSHEHHREYENETCKNCLKNQKITAMQCGPERHSSFHDDMVKLMTKPKVKAEKPEVRHRQECRGKPRHEPPNMEFEVDSANNYLDERPAPELPKSTQPKPSADEKIKVSNFKSKALYCEVKLAELLGRAGPRVRPATPGKYEDAPDSYRASVCCLLLGEISDMDTPYSRVLRTILQNLEQAIYSNYITPHGGGTFDQVPYFELVDKLEAQHERMLQKQDRWKGMVAEQKIATNGIQEHIEELNDLLVREKAKVAELQHDLLVAQRSLRKVTVKAKDLDHKVEQSRALVFNASSIKQKYEEMVDKYDNVQARYVELTKEVQRVQQNLAAARQEAADGVPKSTFNALQDELFAAQSACQKAQKFERMVNTFTPRPNWSQIRGGPFIGFPTTQQAAEIVEENKDLTKRNLDLEAEAAALAVALAEALQPKAPPEKKGKDKGGKGKGKKK